MTGRRERRSWLEGWEAVVAERFHPWPQLDDDEQADLGRTVEWLVRTRHWEAAQGFALSQEVVLPIAAWAALLVLRLDRHAYRDVRAIVVHRSTITARGPRSTSIPGVVADGPQRLDGHAQSRRGPVVLSWSAVRHDLARPGSGRNVVVHELAHKIDAADGLFDGTPEITDRARRQEWVETCTEEYRRLRASEEPDPVLRAYGAQSPSEFFAVATEAFFDRPVDLAAHKPRLYAALRAHYGQDPAARLQRSSGADREV